MLRLVVSSMCLFLLTAQVHFKHSGIILYVLHLSLTQEGAFMKHGYGVREMTDKLHVVFNDEHGRVLSSNGFQENPCLVALTTSHAGHRLINQQELRLLPEQHRNFQPLPLTM